MYCPEAFVVSDPEQLQSFIEQYSFATLVNTVDGHPFATHLPLLLDISTSAHGTLLGHMARANPQWQTFEGRSGSACHISRTALLYLPELVRD